MSTQRRITLVLVAGLLTIVGALLATESAQDNAPRQNMMVAVALGNVIYVDQDAPGPAHNGLSWTTAYTGLLPALTAAVSGVEIWVAEGVYYPGAYVSSTFALTGGVALYGGFAATETLRTQRDWAAHVTILSGDIDRDDANADGNHIAETWADIHGNNANTIVTGNGVTWTAVLDGFTVTAGSAMNDWGGGMSTIGGSPQVANVIFIGNRASSHGGGMSSYSNSNPTLTNVTFSGNQAWGGGGMYCGGMATLTNVTFSGNQAGSFGGGLHNRGSPTLTNVTFGGNQAGDSGGGMYNYSGDPTLTNVTFSGNRTDSYGGGMYNNSNTSPTLANCILWGDSPDEIYNSDSLPTVAYSDVYTPTGIYSGTRNLNADPLFVAPIAAAAAPTTTGNYRLLPASPAIDAGNNLYVAVPADRDGRLRIIGAAVDMGAYEAGHQVYLPLVSRQ
jgi:Chlamydia polymorphic membrane protein (Chlamydia_PMP) repeat